MSVDFELFHDWCKDRFGETNIKIRHTTHGDEICTHSLWSEAKIGKTDNKYHLWMNPHGGKKGIDGGAYRCWLTDTMGSLVSLVSDVDCIPFDDAEEAIAGTTSLRALEKQVHEFFGHKEPDALPEVEIVEEEAFPDFCFMIDKMSPSNFWRIRARKYLRDRKIPSDGLYVCTEDKEYGNRIVIPYYDEDDRLVFWNARSMNDKNKLRYAKPKHGDQESVLYMTEHPPVGSKVHVMEGELDALSLALANFTGAACGGKFLSDIQVELLRDYIPVLAFDADDAGMEALVNVGNALLERGFRDVRYVRPPKVYKDWNKLLVKRNIQTVKAYVDRFEKRFTSTTADYLLSNQL